MAKIITLKDHKTNELAYPQTVSDAVYMDNGSTLEQYKESVSRQFANYPNVTVTGTVTNLPDNEDIRETEQHTLQLADRNNLEGMGYVILRKNKSFAEQVIYENTIYEIRYYFDLNDGSITIPAGCVLKFDGGSIGNGTISGQDTSISAPDYKVLDDISLTGTFSGGVRVTWFGAVGDGTTDCTSAFQAAVDNSASVFVPSGTYLLSSTVTSSGNSIYLYGEDRSSIITSSTAGNHFSLNNPTDDASSCHIVVEHLSFYGDNSVEQTALSLGDTTGFALNVHIVDCCFRHIHTGIDLNYESDNVTIDACHFMWNTYGIKRSNTSTNSSGVRIINSQFQATSSSGSAIDFSVGNNLTICDCILQATNRTNLTFINIDSVNSVFVSRNYLEMSNSTDSSANYCLAVKACNSVRVSNLRTQGFFAYLIKVAHPNWNISIDLGSISWSAINSSVLTGKIFNGLLAGADPKLDIYPYASLFNAPSVINSFNGVFFYRGENIYSITNRFIDDGSSLEIDLSNAAAIIRGLRMTWMSRNMGFSGEGIIQLHDLHDTGGYLDNAEEVRWEYSYTTKTLTITNNQSGNLELSLSLSIPFSVGAVPREE